MPAAVALIVGTGDATGDATGGAVARRFARRHGIAFRHNPHFPIYTPTLMPLPDRTAAARAARVPAVRRRRVRRADILRGR